MARKYFGSVLLNKAYRGEKSLNLVISKFEGLRLAKAILSAIENSSKFDLAVYDYRTTKDGKIQMTVTSLD